MENENFSSYLKTQREKKGIRLEEIASITKIHFHSLELLESGQFDKLPPEPFIRGFIIAYAKYVGLDIKDVIAKYLEEVNPTNSPATTAIPTDTKSAANPVPANPTKISEKPAPKKTKVPEESPTPTEVMQHGRALPTKRIALGAMGALVVVGFLFVMRVGKHSTEGNVTVASAPTTPPKPEAQSSQIQNVINSPAFPPTANNVAPQAPNSVPPSIVAAATTAAPGEPANQASKSATASAIVAASKSQGGTTREVASPSGSTATPSLTTAPSAATATDPQAKHEVVIDGKERTWIKVVVDDKPPIEYILAEGKKATYTAKDKIKVVLGNSTGTVVTHNGEASEGKKFSGTIRSYIFPPNSRFPQDVVSKRATTSSDATATDTQ